ncbi:MAG: NADH-quinone oxidoreductase subunit NuoK [Candidatus Adiutrix sp.]|jgi:NADH-quinone oxidoreductase subunit K|nr:NADH-quinone oxidoreductase subunit NuoK [Candidatus Adiutrix sp.]
MTVAPLTLFMLAALVLMAIGLLGLITRRTLVGMLISVELLLNGAGLSVVAAAKLTPVSDVAGNHLAAIGQLAAIFIMGLAAAEATLVLAIMTVVHRRFGAVTVAELTTLRSVK